MIIKGNVRVGITIQHTSLLIITYAIAIIVPRYGMALAFATNVPTHHGIHLALFYRGRGGIQIMCMAIHLYCRHGMGTRGRGRHDPYGVSIPYH